MGIKTIRLKQFKRFDDLTINLGNNPSKIIALVGPNGCGKSSVFDAFEEKQKQYKSANQDMPSGFFDKLLYSMSFVGETLNYNRKNAIEITEISNAPFDKKNFYIRSPYRFTSRLKVSAIKSLPDQM